MLSSVRGKRDGEVEGEVGQRRLEGTRRCLALNILDCSDSQVYNTAGLVCHRVMSHPN